MGVRELSAVAHGRHNATTDLAYAGGLTGALLGATGEGLLLLMPFSAYA